MKKRDRIYNKYGGLCAYSGKPLGDKWQIDHVIPLCYRYDIKHTSLNHIDNLVPCLSIVNHYKRALSLEGFRTYMMKFHRRLNQLPKKTKVLKTIKRKEYMHMVAEAFDIGIDNPFPGIFYFETIKTINHE